jgi:hypothetical protein
VVGLLLMLSFAEAHGGGVDARGCHHEGSHFHCHGSSSKGVPAQPSPQPANTHAPAAKELGEGEQTAKRELSSFDVQAGGLVCGALSVALMAFVAFWRSDIGSDRASQRARQETLDAEAQERDEAVCRALDAFNAHPGPVLGELAKSLRGRFDESYVPKRGEVVLWACRAELARVERSRDPQAAASLGASVRLFGPLRVRFSRQMLPHVPRETLRVQGGGTLVVTNQRMHFDADGLAKNWTRTWRSIATVGAIDGGVVVETSGSPVLLLLDPADGLLGHPGMALAVLQFVLSGGTDGVQEGPDEVALDDADM